MDDKVIDGVLSHFEAEHDYIEYSPQELTKMLLEERTKSMNLNEKLRVCLVRSSTGAV